MIPALIGITGHKGSGKNAAGAVLVESFGFTQMAFADPIRAIALALDPIVYVDSGGTIWQLSELVEPFGWDTAKMNPEVRRILQVLGTEGGREHLGEDVWLRALEARVDRAEGPVVITDVRFPNEAEWVTDMGGQLWKIERPGCGDDGHASETLIDALFADFVIANDRGLPELEAEVVRLVSGLSDDRPRYSTPPRTHPSDPTAPASSSL